jgi:hypothetical protein
MTTAIAVSGLEKRFGNVRAIDGLDLEASPRPRHDRLTRRPVPGSSPG